MNCDVLSNCRNLAAGSDFRGILKLLIFLKNFREENGMKITI